SKRDWCSDVCSSYLHALDQRAFMSKDIEKYCLNADDIWLLFMEQLKGTLTVWVPCLLVHPPVVGESRNSGGLAQTNVESTGMTRSEESRVGKEYSGR